jgi:hypothetical protein
MSSVRGSDAFLIREPFSVFHYHLLRTDLTEIFFIITWMNKEVTISRSMIVEF